MAGVYTIHGLSSLLFLSFSLRSFSPGTLGLFFYFFILPPYYDKVINYRNPLEYDKKAQRNHEAYPALYSKVNIFQTSIQSGVVCGCVTSKSLFYLLINLYI